jgi:cytochrome P450
MELNPITAVTADQPYVYYERLATENPFGYDAGLRCWVAAGPECVEAALTHPALRVRPSTEPVPATMRDTAIGTLFSRMVRMNDGATHASMRNVVAAIMNSLDTSNIDPGRLGVDATTDALMFAYPSRAITTMLGIATADIPGVDHYARALARAIGPGATADDIRRADVAISVLEPVFSRRFPDAETCANAIAFLFQGYDSLAGTIGHALYPKSDHRELSVHNTRRFVTEAADIAGSRVDTGAAVLVVLATAPRFAFGAGPHACVAAQIAPRIVDAAVRFARARLDLDSLERTGFQSLPNVRIPVFA